MTESWFDYPVTHPYIPSYEGPNTDTPHWAEDIGTPFHTPITAILPGTVKVADYQGWGGEIFIQPDDSHYPEYYFYHPDRLEVHAGEHVQAGQEIALSGGENPGFPGAEHPSDPAYSSGEHTHLGWFTRWQDTQIGTRPYGPPPDDLLAMAKGGPGVTLGTTTTTAATSGGSCTPPTGANAINPAAWAEYWTCQANNAVAGTTQQATAGIASWINSNLASVMARTSAGMIGIGLIMFGVFSIAEGVSSDAGLDVVKKVLP